LSNLFAQPILFAVGINHKTTSIEAREKIYVAENEIPALLAELKKTLDECVVVSTCNRTEIYGVTRRTDLDLNFYKDLLINFKNAAGEVGREDFFGLVSCAACLQLFNVATSLDSKIIGDTQILGQVRNSYEFSKYHGATGKIVNQLFQRAFKVGKQTLAETRIHKGAVSVSLAAVELAAELFGALADKTVLLIGAGETTRLTAECLLQRRVGKIIITNRTKKHAEELAKVLRESGKSEIEVVDFKNFRARLGEANIVISATSAPEPILTEGDFAAQRDKILLIDIAMPRDIAPDVSENENVILKNIDDLNQIVDRNHLRRMADLPLVKKIIGTEMAEFLVWYYSLPLLPQLLELPSGAKPDRAMQTEIVKVKEFLLANASHVHKLAMQNGANDFPGHIQVVNELVAMRNATLAQGV
jgi:glutamyl-tRNA reductase